MRTLRSVVAAALLFAAATGCRRDTEPAEAKACSDAVVVTVAYPGASPSEVEHAVVLAVESSVSRVAGVARMESTAVSGGAEIVVELEPGADVVAAISAIESAVDGITTLPEDAERPLVFHPAMATHWVVTTDASALVGAVEVLGTPREEMTVEVDPDRLHAYGLTMDAVGNTIGRAQLDNRLEDLTDLVIHTTDSGSVLKLGDIATIRTVDVGPVAVRGNARVFVGHMREPPSIGGSVLDVVSPGRCGEPSLVTVTARPPGGLNRPQREEIARRLADAAPDVVIAADAETVRLMLPAGDHAEAVAARLLELARAEPDLIATDLRGVDSVRVLDLSHADLEAMERAADAVITAAAERGVEVLRRGAPGAPQIDIRIDRDAAGRLGLTEADILGQLRAQRFGSEVARIMKAGSFMSVRLVQSTDDDELESLMLRAPSGVAVPLKAVATVELGHAPAAIGRRDMRRTTSMVVFGPSAALEVERLAEVARTAVPGLIATSRR